MDFALNPNSFGKGRQEVRVSQQLIMNYFTAKRLAGPANDRTAARWSVWLLGTRCAPAGGARRWFASAPWGGQNAVPTFGVTSTTTSTNPLVNCPQHRNLPPRSDVDLLVWSWTDKMGADRSIRGS